MVKYSNMKIGEAKALIEQTARDAIRAGVSSQAAFDALPEREVVEAFRALDRAGDRELVGASRAIRAFLWESYARFTVRSYPGHESEGAKISRDLLRAFETSNGLRSTEVARLRISTLKWRIANGLGYKAMVGWPASGLDALRAEVADLRSIEGWDDDVRRILSQATTMLDGLRSGLRSSLEFELPHPLVRREAVVSMTYEGLRADVTLKPETPVGDMIQIEHAQGLAVAKTVVGGGSWPPGVSQISIAARGLVDWTATVPAYKLEEPESDESLSLPVLCADIVRAALNGVAQTASEELDGRWMPTANDIRSISFSVTSETGESLHTLWTQPMGARVEVLDAPSVSLDLGDVAAPKPWQSARTYARGANRSARYFDAVIWANVAVEAFIDEQLEAFRAMPDIDIETLFSKTSVFGEAEEIVAGVHPELAGTISWPDREMSPSRFRQVRGLRN